MRRSLIGLLLAVGAWWLLAAARVHGTPLVAGPLEVARALPNVAPDIALDLAATMGRSMAGFAIGSVMGIVLGVVAVLLRRIASLDGTYDFARSVPPVVLLPVFLLAFGWNESARVATVASAGAWIMALSVTTLGRRSARQDMLVLAGANRFASLLWREPWESLPVLVVGLRLSASMCIIVAVVTEMIAGVEHGIGARILSAEVGGDTVAVTSSIIVIGLAGQVVNTSLRRLERVVRRRTQLI